METVSSKECNDQQFYLRLKKKASSVTGHKLPENCFRNVYKQICGICERDFSCYMLQGRNVAMNMNSCTAPQENLNDDRPPRPPQYVHAGKEKGMRGEDRMRDRER